ncbi:uncharacterized protein CIMG_11251 [Coccidioides immitis RS]|uniref:Uncharacterized protein n=1 Tax=Coccidioides immitis (strain RS) TaxID=246410 RepID=A0A0D8JZD0_COCIM|nr:uncharacterized protein CIMG_11251 [Coccidioides immitis RS]KJF61598.1 hypothetical protein CIMG_11251 [Coccidioides immitis RS]
MAYEMRNTQGQVCRAQYRSGWCLQGCRKLIRSHWMTREVVLKLRSVKQTEAPASKNRTANRAPSLLILRRLTAWNNPRRRLGDDTRPANGQRRMELTNPISHVTTQPYAAGPRFPFLEWRVFGPPLNERRVPDGRRWLWKTSFLQSSRIGF